MVVSQFIGSILLLPAEQVLNTLLAQDPHIATRLAPFAGKTIEIRSSAPSATLTLVLHERRIRLSALDVRTLQQTADARISGRASALLSLLMQPARRPLASAGIEVSGDSLLIQDLFTTLRALDVDWEDLLAPLLGEIPTHELAQLGQQARQWGTTARHNLGRSVDEYLKEEIRLVPDRAELRRFDAQVDRLRFSLDRAAARAESLQDRVDKSLKNLHLSP